MNDGNVLKEKVHKLSIEGREKLHITGVDDVSNFDESTVTIITQMGDLIVKGNDLHISSLNVNEGDLIIRGFVLSCVYAESSAHKKDKSFFKSLFK